MAGDPVIDRTPDDPRIDPRLNQLLRAMPRSGPLPQFESRDDLLALAGTTEGIDQHRRDQAFYESMDDETVAPSSGLRIRRYRLASKPDGNEVFLQFVRPYHRRVLPCVFYIHGGGMMAGSAFDGNYRAFAKLISANDVAVAMIDFRNSIFPSSTADVRPFPAGLDDCISGLQWTLDEADTIGIDPARVIVAGESGGANLSLGLMIQLLRDGRAGMVSGIYAMCPYIAGKWPQERYPSSIENNGILLDLHNDLAIVSYGLEAFERRDPRAWPAFATEEDVRGFPPTMISVNECDPLRDEGVEFYRLLLRSGVAARCRQVMGTVHGTELLVRVCPDISRDTAASIAHFCRTL